MNKRAKYILFATLFLSAVSLFSISSAEEMAEDSMQQAPPKKEEKGPVKYDVKKTQISTYEDLEKKNPIDLKDPSNIKSEIEYDSENNIYLFKTKIGDDIIITPFSMSADDYMNYTLKEQMSNYFKSKNELEVEKKDKNEGDFSFKDIKINLGPAEKIFGPGGVRIKTQGYTEISMGVKHSTTQNPSISERHRSRFMFDFDQKIQLSVNASVGDKVNFGMNYDTESTFGFDSKRLKLAYEGKEDEIVKHLEAGNVSMTTTNSLINGGAALFGIKAGLQFGKLKVDAVISQQESESKTVNSKGGTQTTPFEFTADQYDQNRHFFLSHYFRDNYDKSLANLPSIISDVRIEKVEVWITNKRGDVENARDILAFADLGELSANIKNPDIWKIDSVTSYPTNRANTLYREMTTTYVGARDFNQVNSILSGVATGTQRFDGGRDYEKVGSARLLNSSDYTFSADLGYISLRSALQAGEVLSVAFRYKAKGVTYQVGEFASDVQAKPGSGTTSQAGALYLKLLKPTGLSPNSFTWNLMMKNIYSLGAYMVQKDRFKLNISYKNDSTGTYTNYLQAGNIKDSLLIKVMNLDRTDSRNNIRPGGDGIFDFKEGYTILAQNGRMIFPVIEPFGSHLRKKIGNDAIADKYVYEELYDSTLTVAQQNAEKNKFKISGEYKASSGNEISLGATNVTKGSVKVMAGGMLLQEGVHYTVDYVSGTVTMIDDSYANSSISVSLENQAFFSMQKKTMLGLNLSYDFSKDFNIGGTIMHMYEKPLTMKTGFGNESLKNTLWGLNTSYRTQSQWLTNMIDKLPFVNATQPSQINFNAEFAHMIPGHYENKYGGGYSYLDDFESTKSRISLKEPYGWRLASTPLDKDRGLFPEAEKTDDIAYGNNRALLAWYSIDNLFTRRNSSLTPDHIKNDKEQLSNHYVREVSMSEIYPKKQTLYNEAATIYTMNLSYYPNERGPYNLDQNVTSEGFLTNPRDRWGGMMQKINNQDFETNNVEYIEFWLMDPFIYQEASETSQDLAGDLYINLGEISEDILKDGKKFYENGLPLNNDDPTAVVSTAWGKAPTRQSITYAFNSDLSDENRRRQDVGLNGLNTQEELEFGAYRDYLVAVRGKVNSDVFTRFENDPAGDNYHYFRGSDYDRDEVSILDRYKYYNNTEGNSISTEKYATTARTYADAEDIDQDYTMNETESYFQYKLSLSPDDLVVGKGYVADSRKVKVKLRNDNEEEITWYQFKVPLKDSGKKTVGNINDFKSIRFVRMFLHNFKKTTHLRFATLDLVRAEWRPYTQSLNLSGVADKGTITVSAVNIEENGDRQPVNYVLPPDVSRVLDPGQPNLIQQNEQALSVQVLDLAPGASRAVYKGTSYDLRRYKRIQMYTHVEQILNEPSLGRGDLTIFLRLGSDYKNNYYEYEIPLTVTPHGEYGDSYNDRKAVWPDNNMFDFPLELLKNIKLNRNKEKRKGGSNISFTTPYPEYDPEKPNNKVSVIGNPSLSEIKVIMVGVRNTTTTTKAGEIWVNELRLTDFDEEGGWAAQASLNIALSDLGNVSVSGRKETAGFGSLDQSLMERRTDDFMSYNIATNVDLGRFLPEKAKLSVPFYYSYSKEVISPEYDPFNQDVKLEESLAIVDTKQEKDSIRSLAEDKVITKSLNFNNVKLNIQSKTPMPYDPANFSFGYSFSETKTFNPTTVYDATQNYRGVLSYNYSPLMKSWTPFKDSKSTAPMAKFAKAWAFNYLPSNISFMSQMSRLYTETMIRDLESYALGGISNENSNFLSWSQDFYRDRDFSVAWDFTKNLKASFNSGARAELGEPLLQVNNKIDKDERDKWKDEVVRSILRLGDPLEYRQNAKVTYTLPFNEISFLNWITSAGNYESSYNWNKGAKAQEGLDMGNTINNNMTVGLNTRFNMQTLYNKSAFLKEVNQKFDNSSRARQSGAKKATTKKKRFEQDMLLFVDSTIVVTHNLKTKNVLVTAKLDGKTYPIKFKKIDENQIKIESKDSANIKLSIIEGPDKSETTWYKIAQYGARGLMSVRTMSVNVSHLNSTYLPGFRPSMDNVFGQGGTDMGRAPGAGFAFGLEGGENFITKALNNNWLLDNDLVNLSPATYNSSLKVDVRTELEPIKALKISLNALHEKTDRTDFQFMYDGNPKTFGGSFSMTTIALGTAFQSSSANNNYKSAVFDKFVSNRDIIYDRILNNYQNAGITDVVVDKNSPDVLVPAFMAAYTGGNAKKTSLTFFPDLLSMLPNWNVTYDGLVNIPFIKKKFKSLKLSHSYVAQYRVTSYGSFGDWREISNGLGYIVKSTSDAKIASSPYDVSTISLTEAFNPLFGAEGTLNNNMTIRVRYNRSRNLNLNMSAYQIVETGKNEFIVGYGYRIPDFNRVLGLTASSTKGVNNELKIDINLSYSSNNTLIRKIEENFTQATGGTKIFTIKASADYTLSKSLALKAYLDRIMNTPLISSSAFPTTNTDFGVSLRFTLSQ